MELIPFEQICKKLKSGPVAQNEIPVEHTVSLPLPTLRFHSPAYVAFASPAVRKPGQPMLQDPPDRWLAMSSLSGHLIFYALTLAVSIVNGEPLSRQEIHSPSLEILKETQSNVVSLMNLLAPKFFTADKGDSAVRKRMSALLTKLLPPELIPVYRAVASDFFAWLEA